MFKATGVLIILKLHARMETFTKDFCMKEVVFEEVIFGRSALKCLHLTLTFRTTENLCPNLQKPRLP